MKAAVRKHSHRFAVAMTFVTIVLWGVQPLVMKVALTGYSARTACWVRLTFAFVALSYLLGRRSQLKAGWLWNPPKVAIAGGLALGCNYLLFLIGVDIGGASHATVLIQSGPLMLAVVGAVVYREKLNSMQIFGFLLAVIGFVLFSLDREQVATEISLYYYATGAVLLSALFWVGYCVTQRALSTKFSSEQVNCYVFLFAALLLLPTVAWKDFVTAEAPASLALLYLSFSTLGAYSALGIALRTLPLAFVSALLVVNPFITIAGVELLDSLGYTWFDTAPLTALGLTGTATALLGVAVVVLWKSPRVQALFRRSSQLEV